MREPRDTFHQAGEQQMTEPDNFEESTGALSSRMKRMDSALDRLDEPLYRVDSSLDKLDGALDRTDDFYGMLFRDDASLRARAIAGAMGMEWVRTLDDEEMIAIEDAAVTSGSAEGVSEEEMAMFRWADLVMAVRTPAGEDGFVVVEPAHIAGFQEVDMAVRRARYMSRFTGLPTYAAIASVRNIDGIGSHLTREAPQPVGPEGHILVFWAPFGDL